MGSRPRSRTERGRPRPPPPPPSGRGSPMGTSDGWWPSPASSRYRGCAPPTAATLPRSRHANTWPPPPDPCPPGPSRSAPRGPCCHRRPPEITSPRRLSGRGSRLQQQRDRSVVDQLDLHVLAEGAELHLRAETCKGRSEGLDPATRHVGRRRPDPRRPPAPAGV